MVERVPGEFGPNTHPDDLLLSDYLLGEIDDPTTTRSIEEHLASCEDCRQVLAELGEVVRLLEQLPEPVPSRSFRLTPEMAGVGVEAGAPHGRLLRLAPVARWAGLIAAVFLVALLVTDAVVHHSTTPSVANPTTVTLNAASSASSASSSAAGAAVPALATPSGTMQAFGAAPTVTESTPGAAAAASMASPTAAPGLASTPSAPAPLIGAANPSTGSAGTPAANPAAKTAASSEAASPLAKASGGHTGSNAPAQTASAKTSGSTTWPWHLAELALALLVIWLLLLGVVLPRLSRGHHTRR